VALVAGDPVDQPVRSVLGVELAIGAVFDNPTVELLARSLDGAGQARPGVGAGGSAAAVAVVVRAAAVVVPGQLEGRSATYNVPFAWRLRGRLDTDALSAAVGDVVAGMSRCARCSRLRTGSRIRGHPGRSGNPAGRGGAGEEAELSR
jgi:hypothetical protein